MSTEPTHFLTLMNNGKAFSSLDGMACSYQCSDQFQFLPDTDKPRYWISWDLEKIQSIYLNIILITPGIIWSLKFKTKKKWWNCEITNTNIKQNYLESRYLFCCNYEQSSQNNQCTWCSPLKYGRIFSKKSFSWDKNFFGQKNYGEVVLNWRTNDQIMSRFGRSFINDKCIFQ